MADCHCAVCVQKQHCLGFPDNIAAPDNDTFFAADVNAGFFDKFHDTGRGAGKKVIVANHDFADIHRVECVHVLFGGYGVDDRLFVYVGGQWKLHKYSVYFRFCIKLFDKPEKVFL